jgi:hypothetical protein
MVMLGLNTPNPGSARAVKQGCLCPVEDNNNGEGVFMCGAFHFYIAEICKIHGRGTKYFQLIEKDWICAIDLDGNDWGECS